jgi:DNA-binding NtrC family response regulator
MTTKDLEQLLVGRSPAMCALRERITQIAPSPLSVLIQGPTGAGKELVAQAIHRLSRRPGRFVSFNVSAISESMFADALFGHVRGAFTNAIASTPGYIREADKGTLFMDEIGQLAMPNQVTLLRVLETRTLRPVGGTDDRASDFRLVSATNESLATDGPGGAFREDLLHRLRAAVLAVPALRHRREDIPLLAKHLLSQLSVQLLLQSGAPIPRPVAAVSLTDSALAVLADQEWPGNVRELKSVIECAFYTGDRTTISGQDIEAAMCDRLSPRHAPGPHGERRAELLSLLERLEWDTTAVAAHHNVHRATIYRWMSDYKIPTPDRDHSRSTEQRRSKGIRLADRDTPPYSPYSR